MNKSKLRKEYEARMGVVEGDLCLYSAVGQEIYYECADGYWTKRQYNEAGKQVSFESAGGYWARFKYNKAGKLIYYENSRGTVKDNRLPKAKTFTDENGTQYQLVEITK